MLAEFPWLLLPRVALRVPFYLRSQRWPAERQHAYADRMLRRLVRHAGRRVPYYRDLFRSIGLDPERFRGRVDLGRIPCLDKEVLRTRRDELVSEDAGSRRPEWLSTSGSTGTPVRFMLSGESRVQAAAAALRGYGWAGFLPGMKILTLKGYLREWAIRYSMAGRALNADNLKQTRLLALRLWAEINRLKPGYFHGYPFALMMLIKLGREAGVACHYPHTVISIGESLPRSLRRRLSEACRGARIFDFYGMTENCALILECDHGTKHVLDDYAWHEFVDEEGRAVEAGRGEIVGTSYYNYAMPLIRYRTRDYARLPVTPRTCPCGRPYRAVDAIEGRREDVLQTPDGRFINLFGDVLDDARGILAGQLVQDAPDHTYVNLVPGPDFDPSSLPAVEREVRVRVGEGMRIDLRVVERLERRPGESGKVPFLISRIGDPALTAPES